MSLHHSSINKADAMEGILANRFEYLHRIWQLRYFWLALVKNDLSKRYKRSFLGVGWSLLKPLSMSFILCMVFGKFFNVEPADYVPFLLIGMMVWQFFTESILQGCHSFGLGSAYIRQQQVPHAIFPLRTVLNAAFHSTIGLGVALLITLFFRGTLNPVALLYLPPAMLILFLLAWSMTIISGVMHTHFPDTHHLLEIGLQVLFYLTPILIHPAGMENRGKMALCMQYNPMTSVLELIRTPILEGTPPGLYHVQVTLLFLAVVGTTAFFLLKKLERTLIFWL